MPHKLLGNKNSLSFGGNFLKLLHKMIGYAIMRNVENEQNLSYPIIHFEKKGMVLKMQKKYKVGLIGLGGIAKGAHMSAFGKDLR